MEGRVDFTALDRSRLLSSGSLGGLGPPFSGGDSAHSSSLARFSGGTAAAGAVTGVAPSELARGGSPTALQQYSTRFLPTTNLHTPGTGYAMMAGYLANTGHVPDSLKHLMPEFQQYWSSAMHSEGYARYLFNNMYYPYLSYLPATESLALFAQNSANAAQVQAVLQAQATHHRIYDLQKEAIFGHGTLPHGFYPPSHAFSAGGQLEATNLSLTSGKTKTDVGKDSETRDNELKLELDKLTEEHERRASFHESDKLSDRDKVKEKVLEGSERTRGLNSKTDDRDKIKSSKRLHRGNVSVPEGSHPHFHSPESSKTDTKSFSPKHLHDAISKCHKIIDRKHHEEKHRAQVDKPAATESERKCSSTSHSPQRQSRLVSPERRSSKTHSPVSSSRLNASVSPVEVKYNTAPVVQEMPENLCVKDIQRERDSDTGSVKVENLSDKTITSCVRTQTLVTGTTVTITSTLNVCTADTSECGERIEDRSKNKALLSPNSKERSQISPSLSHSPTMTTYSLPYYHNLYSRSQCFPQQGKRVHAVTYVPEIGTISSPIAGAPSIIDVVDASRSDNKKKSMSESSLDSTEASPKGDHLSGKIKVGKVESPSNNEAEDSDGSVDIIVCDNENHVSKEDVDKEISADRTFKEVDDGGRASKSSDENPSKLICNKSKRDMPKSNSNNNEDNDKGVPLKCLNNKTKSVNSGNKSPPSCENVTSSQSGKEKVVKEKLPVISDPRSEHSSLDESCLNEAQDMRKKPIKDKSVSTVHKVNKTSQQELDGQSVCDMNHNSKARSIDESKSKHDETASKASAAINLSVSETREGKSSSLTTNTVNENDSKDLRKNENRHNRTNGAQVTSIKPILTQPASVKNDKTCTDNEGSQTSCSIALKTEYQGKVAVVPSTKATEAQLLKSSIQKQTEGQVQASVSSIPVGIAVARQRSIAPKVATEKDSKKAADEARGKGSTPDIKHVRPLKIIRPSTTKVSTPTTAEKRNELPANLIVTGGSATSGVFWPDDPASRQLAAQFLQNGNPITPSSWYGQTSFPFSQNIATPTSDGNHSNQLPLTVPPGYKLAQDSLTGQILFIPAGADIYDTSRVFSGFPIGSQLHQNSTFGTPVLPGQQATGSLPTTPSLFAGQQTIGDRPPNIDFTVPQYQQVFNAGVLPGADVIIKDDKTATPGQTGAAVATVVNPTVILPHCAESNPVSSSNDQVTEKDKVIPLTKSTLAPELSVAQQCSYTFPGSALPFVFNSSLIPTHTITDPGTETSHTKHDSMSVQSRGTSPMLPATDSSTEEAEEYVAHTDIKPTDKQQKDKTDECVKGNLSEGEDESESNEKKEVDEKEINVIDIDKNDCEKEVIEIADDTCDDDRDEGDFKSLTACDEQKQNGKTKEDINDETDNLCVDEKVGKVSNKNESSPRTDRNIFTDITEYNPFTDPQVLQAADGLELLSALAEKSSLCSPYKVGNSDVVKEADSSDKNAKCEDVFTFKEDSPPRTILNAFEEKKRELKHDLKRKDGKVKLERELSVKQDADVLAEKQDKPKPRIKCGHAFLPKLKEDTPVDIPKRVTTFCGITIPEDDEVIDSIELEMKLRLAELQRRYKEKQRELARLTPRRDSERDIDKPKPSCEKTGDLKRGPGRPKKRPSDSTSSADKTGEHTSPKSKHLKKEVKDRHAASNTSSNGNGGPSGPTKKKKMAEMIVDRVFRKTGSSFKIPLSKKVSLIAPARIELPGLSQSVDRNEQARQNKSLDFGKLIKRSRLSQLNGKDRSFDGGFWHKKEEKKKHLAFGSSSLKIKKKKKPKDFSVENGLGLLAEYATKSRDDIEKQKRKAEETPGNISPDSPNKKRKPGRPKKCDTVRPGVTETIVAKQSKHIDYFRLQTEKPKAERKISLEGKTPLKPLYLDEWNVRRSERIFLSDPSPQTSPNAVSPGTKFKPDDKNKAADKDAKSEGKAKLEKQKKSRSIDLSQKVKKKYSNGFSQQKAREKTTELLKASRDRLTMKRQENKKKQLSAKKVSSSDSDNDDVPLSAFRPRPKTPDPPKCALEKDSLCDGTRILVFMDGLFHEGELKAIRPPDVYGAILDNERKTRPHYFSQEEILKDAIMDVQATCPEQLKEGIRICAYWSQQFSCLYPGTISRGSPNPNTDNNLFNVEFDDGDTGKIPIDHIRIIPQDFPLVDYDPNPLLLLTKRRRTVSVSETSEPRKSHSEPSPAKEGKVKRGPGRPPKTERMLSNVSVGDEDVFIDNNKTKSDTKKDSQEESKSTKSHSDQQNSGRKRDNSAGQIVLRELWTWSGNSTKRPGLKGKAKKEYYKTVVRGSESISVGECAVFLSTGRPNLPYVGRIESFWEAWGGQMIVKVKWFYHPEETKGGKRLQNMKGALFRSDHEDENDCQTISHKCDVISYADYRRRKDVISLEDNDDVYYLAGSYQPTIGHIKFEPGVMVS